MRHPYRLALALNLLPALLAASAATNPSAPAPDRGRRLRSVLLQLLERSSRDNGVWPAILSPTTGPDLVYMRPLPSDPAADPDRAFKFACATVVLHESFADHPDGVWVGYADGHLEFAPDPATLADCQSQLPLAKEARVLFDAAVDSPAAAKLTGKLTLRLLDPDGRPLAGASVGSLASFGDGVSPRPPRAFFLRGRAPDLKVTPLISNADGLVTVDADDLAASFRRLTRSPSMPLIVFDETRGLAAFLQVPRSNFAAGATRDVRLAPTCTVRGHLTSLALEPVGRSIRWAGVQPFFAAGNFAQNPIDATFESANFRLELPPGDYELRFRTDQTNGAIRYLHISPGQRDVNLQLDLEPIAFDLPYNPDPAIRPLIGHPAPELTNIRAWKNSAPLRMADARGHVLLLDFWGHWCGYCVAAMPDLMKLYDEFHPQGLDVIAVHDNSVSSVQEMDQKLTDIRIKLWSNRDLPFPIALDGGQPPATKDDDHPYHGDTTTNVYHISGFPTTLVIGRDGNVLGEIDPRNPDTRARIIDYLKSPLPPTGP